MGCSTHCGNLRGRGKHFREARQAGLRETAFFSPSFLSLNLHTIPRPPGRSGPSACDWSLGGWRRAPRAFSAPVACGQAAHTHTDVREPQTSTQPCPHLHCQEQVLPRPHPGVCIPWILPLLWVSPIGWCWKFPWIEKHREVFLIQLNLHTVKCRS